MTDTEQAYTPSLDEVRAAIKKALHYLRGSYQIRTPAKRDESIREAYSALRGFDRMIEAVRAEEREKAARIAEERHDAVGGGIAARIRAQGKEQGA